MRKKAVFEDDVKNVLTEPEDKPSEKIVVIMGHKVNVRSAPSLSAKIFDAVNSGTTFKWFDTVSDVDGVDWHEVCYNGKHAYVCGKYSRLVG